MQAAPIPAPAPVARPSAQVIRAPSGRAPASASSAKSIAPAEIAPRASSARVAPAGRGSAKSQRNERAGGGGGGKKKVRGGPELLIAAGVLGLLAVVCIAFYVMRTNERQAAESELEKRISVETRNWKKALESFDKAYNAGQQYIVGKEEFSPEKHQNPFKADPEIINVIYEKNYKDKKAANKTDVKSVDETRLTLYPMNKSKEEGDIRLSYGFADSAKNIPVIIATRSIKGPEGDQANLGGKITVVIKAENDHNFDNARNIKPPEKKEKPAEKTEK